MPDLLVHRESRGSWLQALPSRCIRTGLTLAQHVKHACSTKSQRHTFTVTGDAAGVLDMVSGAHQKQLAWLKFCRESQQSCLWLSVRGLSGAINVEQ